MSALDATARERIGFGQRLARLAASFQVDRTSARLSVTLGSDAPPRSESLLRRHLKGLKADAVVLEIGHRGAGHADWMPATAEHRFLSISGDGPADILGALQALPAGSLDAVFSVDTIEYLKTPWLVAGEIARVLRPGGITFHTSIFTTRYQPQPEDFFRFTPEGLKALFAAFECLTAEFDATERHRMGGRRSGTGDIFGGSREGWRVTYAGRKLLRR